MGAGAGSATRVPGRKLEIPGRAEFHFFVLSGLSPRFENYPGRVPSIEIFCPGFILKFPGIRNPVRAHPWFDGNTADFV